MAEWRKAVLWVGRCWQDRLRTLNSQYREGGERSAAVMQAFDRDLPNVVHLRAQVAGLVDRDDEAAAIYIGLIRSAAALINVRVHPRERIRWMQPAILAARTAADRVAEARLLNDIGLCYLSVGEYREAEAHYRAALALGVGDADPGAECSTLGNLANLHLRQGRPDEAIGILQPLVGKFHELGNERSEGDALNSLGVAHKDRGDFDAAARFHERALEIHRRIRDYRGEASALNNLGVVYRKQERLDEALSVYDQALVLARLVRDERGEGEVLWNMALAYHGQGGIDKAVDCARAALAVRERIEDPRTEKIRKHLALWSAAQR